MARPQPVASRPHMPDYGVVGPDERTGLLPWSWAEERLVRSHDYWLSTQRPGRPHLMPVWGVWRDDALWFGTAIGSVKARNLFADAVCSVATDDAQEPVILEGRPERILDMDELRVSLAAENTKYGTEIGESMIDPEFHAWFRLQPTWAFGLVEADFQGSPTRWTWE